MNVFFFLRRWKPAAVCSLVYFQADFDLVSFVLGGGEREATLLLTLQQLWWMRYGQVLDLFLCEGGGGKKKNHLRSFKNKNFWMIFKKIIVLVFVFYELV